QTNMGYTATWAGRATAFQGVLAVVFSPIVARLVGKIDARALVSFGVFLMAVVQFWRVGFASNASFWVIAMPHLIQGAAVPFFFVPLTSLALGSVTPQETASAAGLMNFTRTTSAAFAVSIMTTAWENTATVRRTDIVGTLNDPNAAIGALTAAGQTAGQATRSLDALVQGQAVMAATDHIFAITALLFLVGSAAIWLAPKPRPMAAGAGGH
ncbi:MAG: MFS transporter, partial [Caulobacteraceae bacterium]